MIEGKSLINSAMDAFEASFAKSLTGTLWDIGTRFVGSTFDVLNDKKQAGKAAQKYINKYQSRYGLLKLLGMPQGVALETIYTPVRVLNELSISQFETTANLEKNYRDSELRRLQRGECRTEDGITVANKNRYLMVLGNPGAGKSTFLRRLGLEAFKGETGRFQDQCIPVLLELKQFNKVNKEEEVDLIAAIAEEFTHFGFPSSPEFATKALEAGKLLVC